MHRFFYRNAAIVMGAWLLTALNAPSLPAQTAHAIPKLQNFPDVVPASNPSAEQELTQRAPENKPLIRPMRIGTTKQILGEKNVAFFSGVTRVEVFQVRYPRGLEDYALPRVGKFALISTGKEQGKNFASQLAAALTDDHIYRQAGALCFDPHLLLRAWNGSVYADVAICFGCSNIEIYFSDNRPMVGASTWNYQHPSFVDLAKTALPSDKSIQSLNPAIVKDRRDSPKL